MTASPTMTEHHISTLPCGLRVISERMPTVRSVALGFWIATGSAMESDEQAGISHLLEHMLFRGCASHTSREIDEIFDAMGAECNAETDREYTSLYTRVLDRHMDRALSVLSEMVWQPRFEDLAAEREVVLEEIAMYEDDPQDLVFDALGQAVFGSHPLGRAVIGKAEVVAAIDEGRLRAFHSERYKPEQMVLAAAGSVDHDALVGLAERACDELWDGRPGGQASAVPSAPPLAPDTLKRRISFLRKDTEQYHVCLGGPGISRHDERRYALRVLEGVLGASASSRLFQEVRERRGLAYSVFSFSNLHAHTGEVGLYVGTRPENLCEAMATISEQLERFVSEPADERELARSRENVKGRLGLALESTSARMSRLASSVLGELPIISMDEIMDKVDGVKASDLLELAPLFSANALSAAGVGPDRGAFDAALSVLGPEDA